MVDRLSGRQHHDYRDVGRCLLGTVRYVRRFDADQIESNGSSVLSPRVYISALQVSRCTRSSTSTRDQLRGAKRIKRRVITQRAHSLCFAVPRQCAMARLLPTIFLSRVLLIPFQTDRYWAWKIRRAATENQSCTFSTNSWRIEKNEYVGN